MNAKAISTHLSRLLGALLPLLILTLGAASAAEARTPRAAGSPSHVPQILRVVERDVVEDSVRYLYEDVYFRDAGGDATTLANRIIATDPAGGIFLHITDDVISAPASLQQQEGVVSTRYGCPSRSVDAFAFTVEDRVIDAYGNVSEPVTFTISCPATMPVDMSLLSIAGWAVGAVLLVGVGLYLRWRPAQGKPLLMSVLLLLCSIMTLSFVQIVLHEGGHALMDLHHLGGQSMVLYVHPFIFAGYSRPMFQWSDTLAHAAGAIVAVLGALLITLPFWKRRSLPLLALVMLFPWSALNNGGYIASVQGDFHNIMQITGLPPVVFIVIGVLIALLGLLMLLSLLPLMGLPSTDIKAVLVLPVALFAWGLLSRIVALLLVPGSPFATRWHLAGEILLSSSEYVPLVVLGLISALLYVTLYRWLSPKLPPWLSTAPVTPAWKDMRLPGLLAGLSIAIGLMVVTL